ncbi:phage terminase small subunit P27 family [Robertmurraya korlensis]|uniref:phage terminase small subunit P27 family n=1 Tax=Robertmurraya korlensis TaxID=519977 RepID=UPI00203CC3AB|nr:phage terminase small subunit P27 family [Robertmurraya korlensis]MCM3599382.1 phage terminase small subunit P27 family [Robertmurraya korlensis]
MARPTKSAKLLSECSQTKAEIEERVLIENKLKGAADSISPPSHLNARQKKIFRFIVGELEASGILGNLDIYILETCVFALDRKQQIQKEINKGQGDEAELLKNLDKYTKIFFRCCNELSLSPQSRAKMGTINFQVKQKEDDPLLKVLAGGKK